MSFSWRQSLAALIISAALILGACGGTPNKDSSPKAAKGSKAKDCGDPSEVVEITALASVFDKDCLSADPGTEFEVKFHNKDDYQHNFSVLEEKGGRKKIFASPYLEGLTTAVVLVPALPAGTYRFECNIHPAIMEGRLVVS